MIKLAVSSDIAARLQENYFNNNDNNAQSSPTLNVKNILPFSKAKYVHVCVCVCMCILERPQLSFQMMGLVCNIGSCSTHTQKFG